MKGMTCLICSAEACQPLDGDVRVRICSNCQALRLMAPGSELPTGIRKGRHCPECKRQTVKRAEARVLQGTIEICQCRSRDCGAASVRVRYSGVPSTGEAAGEFAPIDIQGGITDLLDEVRR